MKKIIVLLCLLLSITVFSGCEAVMSQVETIASQVDLEAVVTGVVESIDWEELKSYAQKGYDALTERYPALKAENVKTFLKENGLSLLNRLVDGTDAETQDNAQKLGEIIKILNPELTEEVDQVIG